MAKSLFRALVALSFFAPLWLNAAPRVITLSPANTELAFAAGITPVGVSSYSDYPPQAQKIEQVSTWQGMNLERIVALKPDLVIAWRGGNAERQVDQLASLGIKVMWVDATSIEQIANALRQLAPWSPQPDKAEQAAQSLLDQYAQLKAQYADKPKKRVFLQFGINPPFTSGKESIQNQVLEVCAIFRTAIGSGTVGMITAASMLLPLVDVLGFNSPIGLVIAMLACAAGGFMVFHGNDDFFWVVTSTSGMKPEIAYKVFPIISVFQSVTALICVIILKMIFL